MCISGFYHCICFIHFFRMIIWSTSVLNMQVFCILGESIYRLCTRGVSFILEIPTKHVFWPHISSSMHWNQSMRRELNEFVCCLKVILHKELKFQYWDFQRGEEKQVMVEHENRNTYDYLLLTPILILFCIFTRVLLERGKNHYWKIKIKTSRTRK